jgi:hypothetical protein
MQLVTRSQWSARPPKQVTNISGPVLGVTLHWEGPAMGSFAHESCPARIRTVQNFHMDSRGWSDIAYNAVVCPHGAVFEGRWLGLRSAANGTNVGNNTHYAVCGLFGEHDPLTAEAKAGFRDAIAFFRAGGAGGEIKPHQAWTSTACPGPEVVAWINQGCPGVGPEQVQAVTDPTPTETAVSAEFFEDGCWTFDERGNVFPEGNVSAHGSLDGVTLNAPIVKGLAHGGKDGYWLVGADGGIFAFGDAPAIHPYEPLITEYRQGQRRIVDAARSGNGLVLVSNLGERYQLGI